MTPPASSGGLDIAPPHWTDTLCRRRNRGRGVKRIRGRADEREPGAYLARITSRLSSLDPARGPDRLVRLQEQHHHRWFKALKVFQIVIAAVIPVAAAADAAAAWIGAGGAVIVALEGLQQLQQYQQNWVAYRSTCERLKHEKFLFLSEAGPYASAERPEALLAERVEGLVSQEHAAWVSQQSETQTHPTTSA